MKNPEYAKQYQKAQSKFKAQLKENLANNYSSRMRSPIIIPIAVHFPSGLESDRTCLEALAQNQVDVINQDFSGTNTDISNWTQAVAQYYPETNTGAANFLFRIATVNHPTAVDPEMVEGGPAVTIGYNFGGGSSVDPAWAGYLNLVVRDIKELGFSPLRGNVANGDAATISLNAFGPGAGCPNSGIVPRASYDLGRAVTHELGHFFNLGHTFTGSCDSDDNIADTPNQNLATFGCPTLGSRPACVSGQQALFQNYMDYSNDACKFMFSAGQIQVAEAYVMSIQDQFKANVTGSILTKILTFKDANFKAALVNDLNINTDNDNEITYAEAVAFTGTIDVRGLSINDLTGIEAFVNIIGLNCSDNNLDALDISNNTALTRLYCENASLLHLNVSNGNNTGFTDFFATNNPDLSCIEVDAGFDPTNNNNWNYDNGISFSSGEPCPSSYFITTWTVDAGESVTIPIRYYVYNFTVDWGDDTTITTIDTSDPNDTRLTHTYANSDTYAVSIYGDFPALYFNNAGDKDKIRTVKQWGDIQWASMWGTFHGCSNLDITATDAPNLQNVADMRGMFRNSGVMGQHTNLNRWNVSNVTHMDGVFLGATKFNQDIGDWDIGNVTNMNGMLSGSNLSVANYGATLKGWAALPNTPTGITLGASGLVYNQIGDLHRQKLTDVYGWTIAGDTREDDYEDPTITLAPIILTLDEKGEVILLATQLDNGSTDNITLTEDLIFSFDADGNETDMIFDCEDLGDHQVTLYVTDEAENSASASTIVTVEEHLGNLEAIAKDITVQLDSSGQVSITPEEVDNGSVYGCGNAPELSLDIDSFDCNDVGSPVTVTLTATRNGQTATATAQVTVEAHLDNLVAVAKDITVQLDASGRVSIAPEDVDDGSGRNGCNNSDPIFISLDKTTFGCNDVGTVSVVLTATQG
ncbi:BspA family leucine-rich repeat surface protein, partial [Aquimarina gracilis]